MKKFASISFRGRRTTTPLSLKSLCGGGVPSSHPSLGLSVFFLSLRTIMMYWFLDFTLI